MPQHPHIVSAVDHVIEPPTVWTDRLSKSKFGARIPHIERLADGSDGWIVDGQPVALEHTADVGALMRDRVAAAKQWDDIPQAAYDPAARLKAMDQDGVGYSVLYPSLAGFSGERFGALTDPELAHVGLSEEMARARKLDFGVLRWSMHENDRAQAERATDGLIKVIITKRGKILGASIVGEQAGELIQMWCLAISQGLDVKAMAQYISPYPTLGEINKRAATRFFATAPSNPFVRRLIRFLAKFG